VYLFLQFPLTAAHAICGEGNIKFNNSLFGTAKISGQNIMGGE
jgi:hypothetical protein